MTLNLNIKANVDNLSLSGIYDLLKKYCLLNLEQRNEVIEYNNLKFKIEVEIISSINYTITEIK